MRLVHNLIEIAGGAFVGGALGGFVVFASLEVIYLIGSYLSPANIFISAIVPAAIAGVIFWKTRMAMFSVAMIVASVAVSYLLWNCILGLFGTYL